MLDLAHQVLAPTLMMGMVGVMHPLVLDLFMEVLCLDNMSLCLEKHIPLLLHQQCLCLSWTVPRTREGHVIRQFLDQIVYSRTV